MAGKGRIRGSKNVTRNEVPMSTGSATCEHCNVTVAAKSDGSPMLHYDGRVKDAWKTQTYCKGPQ